MKGKIGTNAVTGGVDDPKFNDAEIGGLLEQETEVLITVVKKIRKTRAGGAFFKYVNLTNFDLPNMVYLKDILIETAINIVAYF